MDSSLYKTSLKGSEIQMTKEEKQQIFIQCIKMNQEQRQAYFDSGIFNDIVEAYMKSYLKNQGIEKSKEDIHEEMKFLFDMYNSEAILKK